MRNKIPQKKPIVYPYFDHEHARELHRIGDFTDQIPEASALAFDDLVQGDPNVTEVSGTRSPVSLLQSRSI